MEDQRIRMMNGLQGILAGSDILESSSGGDMDEADGSKVDKEIPADEGEEEE